MPEPVGPAAAETQAPDLAWRVASMSLDFMLDVLEVGRGERDVVDALLFGAIAITNLTGVDREAERVVGTAGLDQPLPDALRRPISVNAIAQSLRLPFETARRRIRSFEQAGIVVATPAGVYVPGAVLSTPAYLGVVLARHQRLGRFYADLKAAGALAALDTVPVAAPPGPGAVRLSNRSLGEYMLRFADTAFALTGDLVGSLILIDMLRGNLTGLDDAARRAWAADPLAVAAPVRISAIAARQRLSGETCRRHVLRLADAGFCVRRGPGFVATQPPGARDVIARMAADNLVNVQRLFARLRQLGVLEIWDAAAPAAAAAARS